MYRRMLRIRLFDDEACALAARGELPGSLHTSTNQEAAVVGATLALLDTDYMTGNHRSHGHPIGKGSPLRGLMAELLGKSTGICKGKGGSMHLADFSVGSLGESGIVGSSVPVAVGAALTSKVLGMQDVSLAFFGDGGANTGAVHEAMNLAAVWSLPCIFFCENNGYAVTMPASRATSVTDIADRGAAYGIPGIVVDGQDPVAVFEVTSAAVQRARRGDGPTLIEAKTYRTREHSEGIPLSYRTQQEIEDWATRDPIPTFRARLLSEGVLDDASLREIENDVRTEIDDAVRFAEDSDYPAAGEAFDDLYSSPLPSPITIGTSTD